MTQSFISSTTLLPNKLGEIYSAYNYRLVGEVRWNVATQTLETQNLSILSTPINGTSQAKSDIPTNTYSLASVGNSLWVKVKRTSGAASVLPADIVEFTSAAQPTPRENWIQLAYRNATDEIVMF